jgi:hypothetical protein
MEGYDELPEDGRIDPRNEVFQILARAFESKRFERTENDAGVGGRGLLRTSLIWVGWHQGVGSDGKALELVSLGEGGGEGFRWKRYFTGDVAETEAKRDEITARPKEAMR